MPTSSWRLFLLCLVVLLLSTVTIAQDNCPCCTASHDQFDFFLGEWTVRDTHGKEVGQNRIEELEGGCLIREHYQVDGRMEDSVAYGLLRHEFENN